IDHQHRHTGDLIGHSEFLGLLRPAFYAEGIESFKEGLAINAVLGQQVGHFFRGIQLVAFIVVGAEHRIMHALLDIHRLEREEQLAVQVPDPTEHGRDSLEVHILRELLYPRVDDRLELIAMGAAVPEQLDDFDLARLGHRHWCRQFDVLLAGTELLGVGSETEQTDSSNDGAEHECAHDDSLAMNDCASAQLAASMWLCWPASLDVFSIS